MNGEFPELQKGYMVVSRSAYRKEKVGGLSEGTAAEQVNQNKKR